MSNCVGRDGETTAGSLVTKEKLLETMKLAGMTVSGENVTVSEIEAENR